MSDLLTYFNTVYLCVKLSHTYLIRWLAPQFPPPNSLRY